MVGRAAAEVPLSDGPALEEGGPPGVVHHGGVAFPGPGQAGFAHAHLEIRLQHIFLHVRTGVPLGPEHLRDAPVLVGSGEAGNDGERLYAVVRGAQVGGVAVAPAVPVPVEAGMEDLHGPAPPRLVFREADEAGHPRRRVEGDVVPCGIEQAHVLVAAPVAPVPAALAIGRQPGFIELPEAEIALDGRVGVVDRFPVARVHVIVPEAVETHAREHLGRKFLVVIARRDGGEQRPVGLLPVAEFMDGLAHQGMGGR